MRIEPNTFQQLLEVDVQTRKDGASATVIAVSDDTEVSFGPLHAEVFLRDLKIRVTMNPDEGAWDDLAWARKRAMAVISAPLVFPLVLAALVELHDKLGRRAGRQELQRELRTLLGVTNLREGGGS